MEPTKPLESIHSKDYTLSLSPKVPRVVDIVKNGEEIATCQKNQMKEADTADPRVVTEMRHEGKENQLERNLKHFMRQIMRMGLCQRPIRHLSHRHLYHHH